MARMVFCEVDKIETDGLDFSPWPGEAGKRVFAGVGKPAWQRWLAHQTMLINENRLSPLNPQVTCPQTPDPSPTSVRRAVP